MSALFNHFAKIPRGQSCPRSFLNQPCTEADAKRKQLEFLFYLRHSSPPIDRVGSDSVRRMARHVKKSAGMRRKSNHVVERPAVALVLLPGSCIHTDTRFRSGPGGTNDNSPTF